MEYLYLVLSMFFSASITIAGRLYNTKNAGKENISSLYNVMVPCFASVGWLILLIFDFSFDFRILPYSLLYGIGYVCFTVGMMGALRSGSSSLTALIKQIALVGVSIWGFIFWDTPITLISVIGISLIVVSLALCLLTKEEKRDGHNLSKWLVYATLITVGNAGCSIVQKYQQMAFDGEHKNAFMLFGVLFAAIVSICLAMKEDKNNWKTVAKSSWWCPALAGSGSALSNTFTLLMISANMSPAIIYPGIAVGGLIMTIFILLIFFKEKLSINQWIGVALGAIALFLINV